MSDLIKRLIASGELVLYHDYRSRSLRDWSGQGNDGVAVNTPKWGGGNIYLDDNSLTQIRALTAPEFNMSAFTLLMLSSGFIKSVPAASFIDYHTLFSRFSGGGFPNVDFNLGFTTSGGNTQFLLDDNTSSKTLTYNPAGKRLLALNAANGATASLYADALFAGNFSANSASFNTNNTQPIVIGNYATTAFVNSRIGIQAALIINRQLTAVEHAQIYSELVNMNWESKPGKHAWRNTRPVNVTASTVAQYEMIARGTTVADVSGNGRNGTLTNSPWMAVNTPVGRGFVFSGERFSDVAGYLDTGFGNATLNDKTDDKSCCLWIKSPVVSTARYKGVLCRRSNTATHGINCYIDGSTNQFYFTSYNGASVDNSSLATLRTNNYHHLGFTFLASSKTVQFYVDGEACGASIVLSDVNQVGAANWCVGGSGRGDQYGFDGASISPQFIKAVQDATWWKEQYRAGARAVQYQMGNGIETSLVTSEGGTVGAYLSNSRWRFADGTARYKIGIEQINGQWLKTIESVTAGYLYAPIEDMLGNDAPNSSYGTWEWWQYKTDAGSITFAPVNTNTATPAAGTYYLEASATEAATLVEQGVGNVFSQAGVFTHSVWQKVRLTRSYAGWWRLYVNDAFVVEATDNTSYTTTNWLLNLGVGCKIAGLTKYLGDMSV